ncbi:MAG: sensor histidine kinase [Flavobacteriaceae bacterium]
MTTSPRNDFLGSARIRTLLGWALLVAVVLGVYALWEERQLRAQLLNEAAILHRQVSQRADQHDAHLTALSAIAVAGGTVRQDLFLEVAATIGRFYPRIVAVDLVPLAGGEGMTTRAGQSPETDRVLREAALSSTGALMLRPAPGAPTHYLLVKRSPNAANARYALALEIDAAALMATEDAFWERPSVRHSLWLGKRLLSGEAGEGEAQFVKELGSASQPLVLKAAIAPRPGELLPPRAIVALVAAATLLYAAVVLGLGQLARTRRAERAARLHAQEARLAHASRVNTLGEMASGLAHELTQPLTAILGQVQAGKRLAGRGEYDRLGGVLENAEAQAKRAASILDRLRQWTAPGAAPRGNISVNEAVESVDVLLRAELARAGIELRHALSDDLPPVAGDAVELEQVIFNLLRNAMDAVAGAQTRRIEVATERVGDAVVLTVSDSGPGIPEAVRDRLFEPFVTGKAGGTGLGLALCQRLVERMGGEIALVPDPRMTRFRVSLPAAGGEGAR